jgi:broad specificity phosphatase PhoE
MKMLNTPEDQVAALGNEGLATEHLSEESDLNELISLIELLRERFIGWDTMPAADKRKLQGERDELLRHGDKLASVPENGGSPLLVKSRAEITHAWQEVRKQLEQLPGGKSSGA